MFQGPHREPRQGGPWRGSWQRGGPPGPRRGRFLFLRFVVIFGLLTLFFAGWVGAVAFLLARVFGAGGPTAQTMWLTACGLALVFPLLVASMARRAFRSIAWPLADLMAAADAVARGDLSVRIPARGRGDFSRLATSFNNMISELQRADQQRRNLTADVAHELRTPLHVIQGNLEGIIDGVYEPTEEHIRATLSETRALARLVEDLRTLSLAEAGQLPLLREPVDLGELVSDVATSFSGQAEDAEVSLRVEVAGAPVSPPSLAGKRAGGLGPSPLTITGDAGRLDQVLSNLVANALRYTPAGGTITLRAEARPADDQTTAGVRLTVQDTGEGIPAEDLPFIFDRFWRGDRARSSTRGGGSGLGLAIARQLVQAHGGHISVTSELGVGTKFMIDLPSLPSAS